MTEDAARDESLLVRRLAAGDDPAAWTTFVDRYGPLLQGLARRMLARRIGRAPDDEVDEIVAEVFLALLRHDRRSLRRYDATYRLSTWLGVLCRTAVLRHLRRRGRDAVAAAGSREVARGVEEVEEVEEAERRAALHAALGTLSDRDRLLLTLRYLEGLDYRSIAEALALRPDSVGPLLTRARRRLAERCPGLAELLGDTA